MYCKAYLIELNMFSKDDIRYCSAPITKSTVCVCVCGFVCMCACVCVGDEEEWELQCVWHSQLMLCLDSIEVMMERLHCGHEKHFPQQDVVSPSASPQLR